MDKPAKHFALTVEIKACFAESRKSAGKRTLKQLLANKGINVGLYLIRKIMVREGLESRQPKKYRHTNSQSGAIFENVLDRKFTPDAETTVLCGDTTYIRVGDVWCYLAVVINLLNRQVVGWQFSSRHDAQLVVAALNHAMLNTPRTKKMLFHSDQGSIYGSDLFTQAVAKHRLTQSMSRRGNCWDNAPMERWFRSFKWEWMPKMGYRDFQGSREDIRAYIFYYNHIRPHSYNQGLPPSSINTTYRGLLN